MQFIWNRLFEIQRQCGLETLILSLIVNLCVHGFVANALSAPNHSSHWLLFGVEKIDKQTFLLFAIYYILGEILWNSVPMGNNNLGFDCEFLHCWVCGERIICSDLFLVTGYLIGGCLVGEKIEKNHFWSMQFVCHEVIELLYLGEGCLEFCANAARENKLSLLLFMN